MAARRLAAVLALLALPALAAETAQWPPPAGEEARMRELQQAIIAPDATPAQREAARAELAGMLKSPAGRARGRTPDEKPVHPPRAAIDPFPSVVKPVNIAPTAAAPPPPGGVARVEVVIPPKPVVVPQTGSIAVPADRFAIDPRTGHVLHETPGGYVDPLTGRFTPR
jgi:hypothetical protein